MLLALAFAVGLLFGGIQFTGAAVANAPDRYHAVNALQHIIRSPLWTQRLQAKGTPARLATWGSESRAPIAGTFVKSWLAYVGNGTGLASGVATPP